MQTKRPQHLQCVCLRTCEHIMHERTRAPTILCREPHTMLKEEGCDDVNAHVLPCAGSRSPC